MLNKNMLRRKGMKIPAVLGPIAFFIAMAFSLHAQIEPIVLVTEIWPPYRIGANDDPQTWTGIDIDLIREIESRTKIGVTIINAPWARCLEMIKLGQADIMTGVAWTTERSDAMIYVPTSYDSVRPVFYAPSGKGAILGSYEDLRDKSIGQSINSAYFDRYNNDKTLKKVSLKDEETILRMLALGRLDLAIGTEPNLSWDIARYGLKGQLEPTVWQPGEKTPLFIVVSKKTAESHLAARIDASLREIIADGTMTAIQDKYR